MIFYYKNFSQKRVMKRRDCVRGENIHVPVVALLVFGNKAYLSLAKLGLWLSLAIAFYTTKLNLSNDAFYLLNMK